MYTLRTDLALIFGGGDISTLSVAYKQSYTTIYAQKSSVVGQNYL